MIVIAWDKDTLDKILNDSLNWTKKSLMVEWIDKNSTNPI